MNDKIDNVNKWIITFWWIQMCGKMFIDWFSGLINVVNTAANK